MGDSTLHDGAAAEAPAAPAKRAKFSDALGVPFTRRTWPSMATADRASQTGVWHIAKDISDSRSSGDQPYGSRVGGTGAAVSGGKNAGGHRLQAATFSNGIKARYAAEEEEGEGENGTGNATARAAAGPPAPPPRTTALPPVNGRITVIRDGTQRGGLPRTLDAASTAQPSAPPPPSPSRLANLFGYRLADANVMAVQKARKVQRLYGQLQAASDETGESLREALQTMAREQLLPLQWRVQVAEAMITLHTRCSVVSDCVAVFEEMVVQSIVRAAVRLCADAAAQEEEAERQRDGENGEGSEKAGSNASTMTYSSMKKPLPSRVHSKKNHAVLVAARSFAQLELALMSLRRRCSRGDTTAASAALAQLVDVVSERFSTVKSLLPLGEAEYYDYWDCAVLWGPSWRAQSAIAEAFSSPERLASVEGDVAAADTYMASWSLLPKMERVVEAHRARLTSKSWVDYETLCDLLK